MTQKLPKSIKEFFEFVGGIHKIIAVTERNQWVVERWQKTGIPFKNWKALIREFGHLGVDVHLLSDLSQRALDKNAK